MTTPLAETGEPRLAAGFPVSASGGAAPPAGTDGKSPGRTVGDPGAAARKPGDYAVSGGGIKWGALHQELHNRSMRQEMHVGCALCEMSYDGPASLGIKWAAAHRAKHHPAARDRGQRARKQASRMTPR